MNILVVGSTGVLGRNVIPRLLERGHQVRAVVRRADQARIMEQAGVDVRLGDIFDRDSLDQSSYGSEAVLHLATAVPKNANQDWSLNDRIRREGTRNLLDAVTKNGVKRYIQQSIALIYGEKGQEIVDESAPVQVTPISHSAEDMEAMVRSSGLDWSILRGGLFYGPGTGQEEKWWQSAREGRLKIPGDGSDLMSLVHVVDMARAVVVATEHAPAGSLFNITDNEPVRVKDLFGFIAAQSGGPAPQAGDSRFLPSLGVSNVKAQMELAWRPAYPNYRIGLAYGPLGVAKDGAIKAMASPDAAEPAKARAVPS